MAKGRGSANNGFTVGFLTIIFLLVSTHLAEAGVYQVGDNGGWNFNSAAWANGKKFKAGDQLVFNYNRLVHNVVSVNSSGFKKCKAPKKYSKVYKSGSDQITLRRGINYFICSVPGHCKAGMKIAIRAF
ncbi:hypothetical protein LUZ60_000183 [Juncus effusus]|nr:hypothetical protein LUZ60_000183 [Juncus effusus]